MVDRRKKAQWALNLKLRREKVKIPFPPPPPPPFYGKRRDEDWGEWKEEGGKRERRKEAKSLFIGNFRQFSSFFFLSIRIFPLPHLPPLPKRAPLFPKVSLQMSGEISFVFSRARDDDDGAPYIFRLQNFREIKAQNVIPRTTPRFFPRTGFIFFLRVAMFNSLEKRTFFSRLDVFEEGRKCRKRQLKTLLPFPSLSSSSSSFFIFPGNYSFAKFAKQPWAQLGEKPFNRRPSLK